MIFVYLTLVMNILLLAGNLYAVFSTKSQGEVAARVLGTVLFIMNIFVCCIALGWL